jgi:GntP family gluconate:H+ symporter
MWVGEPNTALMIGVALAFWCVPNRKKEIYEGWVGQAIREAGPIILITGAGGAFGRILQTTPAGEYLGSTLSAVDLGAFSILLPVLVAMALKTMQGSSTVAIITTASITAPLLPSLGLANGLGPVFTSLAIGTGSMMVSHANDSYFWVVSQFSGMTVDQAYRLHTTGSAVGGLTGTITLLVLSLLFL